jgi:hypothetical protein
MLEIGKFFESALRDQSAELKKAALGTVTRMGSQVTLAELLSSDAGQGIRHLSLRDILSAFEDVGMERASSDAPADKEHESAASDQERIYLDILAHLGDGPQTIGQLAKSMDVGVSELRAYLDWMRGMGKVSTTGRARATRYHLSA